VYVCDHSSQVQIDDCVNCKIFIGPCDGSVFIRDTMNCSLCVYCRQLRTRDCRNLDISLFCATQPSLETSTGIQIAPWNGSYPGIEEHMRLAHLDTAKNMWDQVYDFSAGVELDGDVQHWRLNHDPQPQWTTPLSAPAAAPAGTDDMLGSEAVTVPEKSPPLPPLQSPQEEEQQAMQPSAISVPSLTMAEQQQQQQQQQQQDDVGINGFTNAGHQLAPARVDAVDARDEWRAENRVRLAAVQQDEEERRRQMRERAAQALHEREQARESRRQARHADIPSQDQSSLASFKADQGVSGNGGATGWAKVTHLLWDPATGTIRQVLGTLGLPSTHTAGQGQGQERTTIAAKAPAQTSGSLKDVGRMRDALISLAQQQQQQQQQQLLL
ncbi:tubulin binding cofactor C-domain-containing protein, partial [Dunaliella salina]